MKEYYESHVSTHVFKALDQMLYVRHDTGRNCLDDPSKLHIWWMYLIISHAVTIVILVGVSLTHNYVHNVMYMQYLCKLIYT